MWLRMSNDSLQAVLSPPDRADGFTIELLKDDYGFMGAKLLDDGCYVGVKRLFSTVAIHIGIDRCTSFERRYCFKDLSKCLEQYALIKTKDDIPEGWIARRPAHPEDNEYRS